MQPSSQSFPCSNLGSHFPRKWLLDAKKKPELDSLSSGSDEELHTAILQLEIVQHTGFAYVYLPSDNATLCAFRKVSESLANLLSPFD